MKDHKYDASNIKILGGVEAVRKRPDMYIGDRASGGLHHLVYEVLDNCVDEALAGYCDNVIVHIQADGSCTIEDNGVGRKTSIRRLCIYDAIVLLSDRRSMAVLAFIVMDGVTVISRYSCCIDVYRTCSPPKHITSNGFL